jgi:hypothetical protein
LQAIAIFTADYLQPGLAHQERAQRRLSPR